jgi:hypothetical protein
MIVKARDIRLLGIVELMLLEISFIQELYVTLVMAKVG